MEICSFCGKKLPNVALDTEHGIEIIDGLCYHEACVALAKIRDHVNKAKRLDVLTYSVAANLYEIIHDIRDIVISVEKKDITIDILPDSPSSSSLSRDPVSLKCSF